MQEKESQRPWGKWEILSETKMYKIKRITVNKNKRLSYQKHQHRQEIWTIIKGEATITLEGKNADYKVGDVIEIPLGAAHRVKNKGEEELVFIEVQTGDYFGEDDIIRLEDDYGRA